MGRKSPRVGKRARPGAGVRDVIRGCPQKVVGEIAWLKGGERINVPWESRPERDTAKILAADARIKLITHQPFIVSYRLNGELHKYTPDYKVIRESDTFILEVKELADAMSPENQARFPEIARVLALDKFEFKVWTETEYRQQPLLMNSNYVLRFRNYPFDELLAIDVVNYIESKGSGTPLQIGKKLRHDVTPEALFAMVCFGRIYIDCSEPFSADPTFFKVPANAISQ